MAEILGAIQRGLGAALNAIYEVVPSYAIAIVILTMVVRALMIPLTVKQVKSMQAMQKLAPEQKKVQAKYKELQKKATDRAEVQQLRMQMNQEVQGLFRQHGVNPLGGCLPMLAQFPVYIGMFSIMRAAILAAPMIALTAGSVFTPGSNDPKANIPADTFTEKELRSTVCLPTTPPRADGPPPTEIVCRSPENGTNGEPKRFKVGEFQTPKGETLTDRGAWIATCRPTLDKEANRIRFGCGSAVGTGHLPKDGALFEAITLDEAELVPGVHAGCTAAQAASKVRILECSQDTGDGGGASAIPYYLLIVGIAGSQYYQGKQMLKKATGPQADAQRAMMRFMPLLIGFVSFNIPAGANLYFMVSNLWTIGQQHILLTRREAAAAAEAEDEKPAKATKVSQVQVASPKPERAPSSGAHPSSKKRKKKKKKR